MAPDWLVILQLENQMPDLKIFVDWILTWEFLSNPGH